MQLLDYYLIPTIFNSEKSILRFLEEFSTNKDRIVVSMRKKLFEVLTEYIEVKYTKIYPYLDKIFVRH